MRVSIVGGNGEIGERIALLLGQTHLVDHIILAGRSERSLNGTALDLQHGFNMNGAKPTIEGAHYLDPTAYDGADVIVMTAGAKRTPDMKRSDLVKANSGIVREVGSVIGKSARDAFVIVVSNPLDALTHLMHRTIDGDPARIVGMAGILDSARFRTAIADKLKIPVSEITRAEVIGEHGETMFPVFSRVAVNGLSKHFSSAEAEEISANTRGAGVKVSNLLNGNSANRAPAAGVVTMIRAYINNTSEVIPSSVHLNGEYGLKDIFIGVPAAINSTGARPASVVLHHDEISALHKSAESVRGTIELIPPAN